jgi:hypothetical protein
MAQIDWFAPRAPSVLFSPIRSENEVSYWSS